jgi:hypothetical protein
MGSVANPMLTSLLPGSNPSGVSIALADELKNSSKGTSLIPTTPTSASSVSNNPYAGGVVPGASTTPSFPANGPGATSLFTPGATPRTDASSAAASPIGGMNLMSKKDLSRLFDGLKKTYGDGPAHALLDFLTSGAGFNQNAINNLFAALQPQINRGTENIMEQFSALGNRFGSGAQIGLGDYLSQVNLNEGQIETQMYEEAVNKYIDVLMGTSTKGADRIASSPSSMDSILSGIGLGGKAAGGASSIISKLWPNADTGILDTIAGAAAFA